MSLPLTHSGKSLRTRSRLAGSAHNKKKPPQIKRNVILVRLHTRFILYDTSKGKGSHESTGSRTTMRSISKDKNSQKRSTFSVTYCKEAEARESSERYARSSQNSFVPRLERRALTAKRSTVVTRPWMMQTTTPKPRFAAACMQVRKQRDSHTHGPRFCNRARHLTGADREMRGEEKGLYRKPRQGSRLHILRREMLCTIQRNTTCAQNDRSYRQREFLVSSLVQKEEEKSTDKKDVHAAHASHLKISSFTSAMINI